MADNLSPVEDTRIRVMLEEYRALYSLLVFRLNTMEQRLPIIAALLSATLGGASSLPHDVQPLVFMALPPALVWFLRTTLGHARSKQDVKSRIDEIERAVNRLIGEELLAFQSRHPSRGRIVAGRSGRELVLSVYLAALALLAGCVSLYPSAQLGILPTDLYVIYASLCGLWMSHDVLQLGRYRPNGHFVVGGQQD